MNSQVNFTANADMAQKMLNILEPDGQFTFQTFNDAKNKGKPLTNVLHGTLSKHKDVLANLNQQGAGVFVTINQTNLEGRTSRDIKAIRALFVDFDTPDDNRIEQLKNLAYPPTLIVESSPDKHHAYWVVNDKDGIALDEFKPMQQRLIQHLGSDPAVCDLPRVMRLPGFYHCKDEPFMTHIVHEGKKYNSQELRDWVNSLPAVEFIKPKACLSDESVTIGVDLERAQLALNFIPPDDYHIWMQIGMALHSTGHPVAFEIWDIWSNSSQKYQTGKCAEKWQTFRNDGGIKLATIFHYFQEHVATDYARNSAWQIVITAINNYPKERDYLSNSVSLNTPEAMLAMLILEESGTHCWGEACNKIKNLEPKFSITDYKKALKDSNLKSLFGSAANKKESEAAKLIKLATMQGELVHDTNKVGFIILQVKRIRQCWGLRSQDFQEYLFHAYYSKYGVVPASNAIKQAVETLEGKAKYDGREVIVYTRTAKGEDGAYYLDLCNDKWQAVQITAAGWTVLKSVDVPVFFTRNHNMRNLPMPTSNDTGIDALEPFWGVVNIPEADRGVVLAWLLESLRPDTSYPILEISGEQGSAKSSTQKKLRSLIDPNKADLRAAPNSIQEVFVSAKNGLMVSYENLSFLPTEMQDALCSLATGVGYSTRTLYTNLDETVVQLRNPVILNGISQVVTTQDLLDRTIHINLPRLSQPITEAELGERWDEVYPNLFTGLLDLFCQTLAKLPEARVALSSERLPRMADFTVLGAAMYLAQGKQAIDFLREYVARRAEGVQRILDSDPAAVAMLAYLDANPSGYIGPVQGLLDELRGFQYVAGGSLPNSAKALGDKIRRLSPAMAQLGIVLVSGNRIKGRCTCRLVFADSKVTGA